MEPTAAGPPLSDNHGHTLRECVKRHTLQIQHDSPAVYICDKEGYIKFYNKAAVNLWGRTPEIGKDLWCGSWKIFTPDGSPTLFDDCPMARTMKQGIPIHEEEILIERPDGMRRNVMAYPEPIFDSGGSVIGAINVLVDITLVKEGQNN